MTPCPSALPYAALRLLSCLGRKDLSLPTHPRPLVLSSTLLCQPTTAGPAAANEMPIVAHKGRVVPVRALPAKAHPHTGLAFPWGSSGQLPLRFTARTLETIKTPPIPRQLLECLHHTTTPGLAALSFVQRFQATGPLLHCVLQFARSFQIHFPSSFKRDYSPSLRENKVKLREAT